MLTKKLADKLQIKGRNVLVSIALVTNAFVWYFFAISVLKDVAAAINVDLTTTLIIWGAHFGGICFSAVAGARISSGMTQRRRFLLLWTLLGIASSCLSIVIDKTYLPNIVFLSAFLGVSLGIGMPSCMGYFTESIHIQNRGRVGGVILCLSGITMFGLSMISNGEIGIETIALTICRGVGLLPFVFMRDKSEIPVKSPRTTYLSLIKQRPFVLYLIPWIMFSLITYLTIPIANDLIGKANVDTLIIIENFFVGIFSLTGGFLLDIVGRKRIAIAGFTMLGLGYSILGIYPGELLSWYFYTIVDGIAWGMLFVLFVVTIWGDLSHEKPSDVYYAIGVLPFFVSKFLQLTVGDLIALSIREAVFSFTAFLLFLAVLPLIYTPETLPEKLMKDRDLKSYVEKALKKVQKETEKAPQNPMPTSSQSGELESEDEESSEETDDEYEEARKLAEKYY
ncbi:MAG: MFS transporter [Candidatus Bathyarchaeota archaeon]|nr:MFS transporter [Candidatus Bathyarchaeota archaeon]